MSAHRLVGQDPDRSGSLAAQSRRLAPPVLEGPAERGLFFCVRALRRLRSLPIRQRKWGVQLLDADAVSLRIHLPSDELLKQRGVLALQPQRLLPRPLGFGKCRLDDAIFGSTSIRGRPPGEVAFPQGEGIGYAGVLSEREAGILMPGGFANDRKGSGSAGVGCGLRSLAAS